MCEKLVPKQELTPEQKFEVALARFQDHCELLRKLTSLDFQILGGCLTILLGATAWLAEHPPTQQLARWGIMLAVVAIALLAATLLRSNARRRDEVVAGLKRAKRFLGLTVRDTFFEGHTLDSRTKYMRWLPWYLAFIAAASAGTGIVLFSEPRSWTLQRSAAMPTAGCCCSQRPAGLPLGSHPPFAPPRCAPAPSPWHPPPPQPPPQ